MSMRLLIECARARPDAASVRQAAAAVADWDQLLGQAAGHGMAPLLYGHLSQACLDIVPPPILDRLHERADAVARTNLRLTAELVRLASLFDRAGIQVVTFKGPALVWSLYESPAQREMSDLDLLVRPSDTLRAIDLLVSAGYQEPYRFDLRFSQSGHELPLVSAPTGVAVDLHWSLAPPGFCRGLDMEGVWTRLTPVQVAGRAVRTLGNEDLLIFLCVHGAKHAWCSLHWLADLARLIDRGGIDWDGLIGRVRARRISRMVFASVLLAVDLLGATVPAGPVAQLRAHSAASGITARVQQRLLADLPLMATMREQFVFQFGLLERAADKLRYCWSYLEPSPTDRESLPLPAFLFPLYYAFRPLRGIAKYTALAARRVWTNLRIDPLSRAPSVSNSASRGPTLSPPN